MQQIRLLKRIVPIPTLLTFFSLLLTGCGTFSFYEDTKVAISIKVDPKAPDPVEISAAYKESVFALVPVGTGKITIEAPDKTKVDVPTIEVGQVISDFDVNYGVNAGLLRDRQSDFLYVVITHGIATGRAATKLATPVDAKSGTAASK